MSSPIVVDEEEPEYDLDEPAFELRDVTIRKDKWVADEYEIQGFLGRGKFGEVKRCTEKSSGREFAAKFISATRPQDRKDVQHELNIMKKLYHKRLIQLYDAFESKTEMCLVLEIIYGGELFDRVISDDFILTEKACVAFVRQICEGLEYMHHNMIIHLDMKPENILCLTRTGNRIKIIDFGLAREYHPKKDLRVLFGTPEFMAPEVVQYETISYGTDMWSVGVICYVLLSGLSPFMGDSDADTLTNVVKSQYDFNYAEFDDVSDEAKDLITNLLAKDKNKRLTASECLQHPWLARPPRSHSPSPNLSLSKKRLKRFVYRRKWQKSVNAIIALRRMGFQLMALQRQPLAELLGSDFDISSLDKIAELDLTADEFQRSLNKRKPSDSGYESVAVEKDMNKDLGGDIEGLSENDTPMYDTCFSAANITLDAGQKSPTTPPADPIQPPTERRVSEATLILTLPGSTARQTQLHVNNTSGGSKDRSPIPTDIQSFTFSKDQVAGKSFKSPAPSDNQPSAGGKELSNACEMKPPSASKDRSPGVAFDKYSGASKDRPPGAFKDRSPGVSKDRSPGLSDDQSPGVSKNRSLGAAKDRSPGGASDKPPHGYFGEQLPAVSKESLGISQSLFKGSSPSSSWGPPKGPSPGSSRGSSKEPSPGLPRDTSLTLSHGSSRGSSKEPSPSLSGATNKKPSILDRFGGLFLNYKDKDKDVSSKKPPKKKNKDKESSGIVKKDSLKRKIGNKAKQEVYVTTPVVKKKHPDLELDAVSTISSLPNDVCATAGSIAQSQSPTTDVNVRGTPNIPSEVTPNTMPPGKNPKGNGAKKSKGPKNGGPKLKIGAPTRGDAGSSVDGTSVDPVDDVHTPPSMMGNVQSKRKMFEKNGRAS